ncbi:RNA polymerase sigma factor [Ilumatobacter fluminis]|uniref:RNA polymerase sigma factor n=1 Tax=Ilumatobacter fluminis TaxID=467091 RepID=UPI0014151F78|nr:sigma-70 family RNA polymerase sigma factor [Ilumatobacter fluminis]
MKDVIVRAAAGDPDALGELWRGHQHLLLRYFRGKGMNEPEDLASTVWVEVARGLSTFDGDANEFRRWLFTIAARRRIDEIRRDRRRRNRDEILQSERQPGPAAGADVVAERAASLDRAIELVQGLPPDQAEAVLLRVVADLTVADVALIMNRSEGSVRVLTHRGLKRLAERADSGGHGPANDDSDINSVIPVTDTDPKAMYAS